MIMIGWLLHMFYDISIWLAADGLPPFAIMLALPLSANIWLVRLAYTLFP